MYKNHIILALRNLWKQKTISAINILGLAIGLAASLLILVYVQFELSYDRHHLKLDRMYRISLMASLGGNDVAASTSPYPLAMALRSEFPEVETAARVRRFFEQTSVAVNEIRYQEYEVFHADQAFFDIFTVAPISGDIGSALSQPNAIVITQSMARKYFGSDPALGEIMRFNNDRDYEVTAVIEDFPANSHFHPDILVSFLSDSNHDSQQWTSNNIQTYVLLREGASAAELNFKLQELVAKYVAPQIEAGIGTSFDNFIAGGGRWEYRLLEVAAIHLSSMLEGELEPPGNAAYVVTFQAVAVFILILACINFTNLSTARSANRAREIGIRKVVGAVQGQLLRQFLLESILTSLLALLLALPLVAIFMPTLNAITDRELSVEFLFSARAIFTLAITTVMVGVLAGSYPAIYLSRFHPQQVLKGSLNRGGGNYWMRSALVIVQFIVSVTLIAATLIVFSQLDYMRNKDLGFDRDALIVIERAAALENQLESYKNQVGQLPGVISVTSASHLPADAADLNAFMVEGRPNTETDALYRFTVGYDYLRTLGIELIAGRSFSPEFSGEHPGFILNQAAVRQLQLNDPLSSNLIEPAEDGLQSGRIIGVVSDFHFMSLHQPIEPMVFRLDDFARFVIVKVEPEQVNSVLNDLEMIWGQMIGEEPFVYKMLGDSFDALHSGEERVGELFIGFSALAIIIACLGLYGLAAYSTSQRTREIGIRKTLGAPVAGIVYMISKEFLLLVLIAIVGAIPLAYLVMSRWLEIFAYRIEIGPLAFLVAGLAAIVIALCTVGYQSFIAANSNPSLALRDE